MGVVWWRRLSTFKALGSIPHHQEYNNNDGLVLLATRRWAVQPHGLPLARGQIQKMGIPGSESLPGQENLKGSWDRSQVHSREC